MLPNQESMTAEQILEELKKLVEKEQSEKEPKDVASLSDAIASVEEFINDEKAEPTEEKEQTPVVDKAGVVDTGVLTGPMDGLKNFLIKKERDQQS